MRRFWKLVVPSVCLLLFCTGCGTSTDRLPLEGTVLYQGKPLEQGHITFLTTSGAPGPVCGAVIRDGSFEIPTEQGLAPGSYRVQISSRGGIAPQTPEEMAAGASPRAKELLPAKYNDESTLTAEIATGSPNELVFSLE